MALKYTTSGYDSTASFSDSEGPSRKASGTSDCKESKSYSEGSTKRNTFDQTNNKLLYCNYLRSLTAYERHKMFINNYFMNNPQAKDFMKRDDSHDKRDIDVIKENHQFLWDEEDSINSWGKQLANKYYSKLFKEYCICDLTRYKEGLAGMRWRTQKEVKEGKGQFTCGEKHCCNAENLRTWEMNFGYIEQDKKKNALIKLRLCNSCSYKVNYKHRRKEVKKCKNVKKAERFLKTDKINHNIVEKKIQENQFSQEEVKDIWKGPGNAVEIEDQNEEFEEYLEDLFL